MMKTKDDNWMDGTLSVPAQSHGYISLNAMSRPETEARLTDRNTLRSPAKPPTPKAAQYIPRFRFVISRLFNAVRSGIAGAVALGSAYAVSMPQKAEADLITSHADIVVDATEFGNRTVYYESSQVNYFDSDGASIPNGLTNKIVLFYIKDQPGEGLWPIGGLTIQPGQTQTDSGWFWSRDGPPYENFGLQVGEIATNNLGGTSLWGGGIDLDNNGEIGNYTFGEEIAINFNEGLYYFGDPNAPTNAYTFRLNGVPAHPESGTGPMTIDSIDIFAPWQIVPEPSTTCAFLTASLDAGFPTLAITNFPPTSTVTVQRCDDLMATNWLSITNLSAGFTNWIDYTLTGGWDRVFYKLAR